MTHTEYQKYIFGPKSCHLKIGVNGAAAYTIPQIIIGLMIASLRSCLTLQHCETVELSLRLCLTKGFYEEDKGS